jgi:hypothetical protein
MLGSQWQRLRLALAFAAAASVVFPACRGAALGSGCAELPRLHERWERRGPAPWRSSTSAGMSSAWCSARMQTLGRHAACVRLVCRPALPGIAFRRHRNALRGLDDQPHPLVVRMGDSKPAVRGDARSRHDHRRRPRAGVPPDFTLVPGTRFTFRRQAQSAISRCRFSCSS